MRPSAWSRPYSDEMHTPSEETNGVSTTWTYRKVKMGQSAGGQRVRRPKGVPRLSRLSPRVRQGMRVVHRGGSESWWEIEARGRTWRFPGHLVLDDVLQTIYAGDNRG